MARITNILFALLGAIICGAVVALAAVAGAFDDDDVEGGSSARAAAPAVSREGSSVADIYERVQAGVVFIEARKGGEAGAGSGFVIDDKGSIVTNQHVVDGADRVRVRFGEDGDPIEAEVRGTDASTDLAVLRIDPDKAADDLRPLELAQDGSLRVGEAAIAIGSPFGLSGTVTSGIVSAVGREIDSPNGFQIDDVVQTDAAINPGNSGGPLLDERGRVIGVNAQLASNGGAANSGVGFAIPIATVREIMPRLEDGERIERAFLGVSSAEVTPEAARELDLPSRQGALVGAVVPDGPAARAGLRPADSNGSRGEADLIVEIDGRRVNEPSDLVEAVERRSPGDKVDLVVLRGGERKTVSVELGTRPDRRAER